ncbi:hypothetical protein DACRYDRAFT_116245 [Dacryopinax primogenitus]|uniref:Nucleotide-diphospho-sugar transferase domain-containing protein n=1 Tax=Dacryopinax primogenitus (strain DJM 731) TaxID=1858805 RepID=M5G0Y4_DACPD|nr:uncharacterized protein DACRYDRAFT_116245 [Dacryopinax primogenitus]EJU01805.1 hypothetical protein DACRYDRAFT_116245 [Dacryopinax primogenitus]
MFSPLRLQATRLATLFGAGILLLTLSILYGSFISPSTDSLDSESDSYYGYYGPALSAASRFFHGSSSDDPSRVTLFTWGGGNKAYALEPLEEYAELASYPVGARPWIPNAVEGGTPEEWTLSREEKERLTHANAEHQAADSQEWGWEFPAPQVDVFDLDKTKWEPPTIEFALVIMGESAAVEAVTMIKGILMHISTPVHLHIVCDEAAMYYIDDRLTLVHRPAYDIHVSYNLLSSSQIWARGARAGIGSTYHAGAGGLAKVFLHEILTETKRAIFIDIDTLFTVDPLLLWKEFDKFKPGQVFALPTLGPGSDELTVCSCSLLLDLEAMRDRFQWVASDLRPQASRTDVAYSSLMSAGLDPHNPPFGDQGVYYAIWRARPELAGHLGLSWDVSHCRNHWGFALDDGDDEMTEEEQVRRRGERMWDVERRMADAPERWPIFPGILHFNCIDNAANSFTYSDIVDFPTWGPVVQVATQYKWTWLNRGDGSAKVDRVMYEDVRFADERWPEGEREGGWTQPEPVDLRLEEGLAFPDPGQEIGYEKTGTLSGGITLPDWDGEAVPPVPAEWATPPLAYDLQSEEATPTYDKLPVYDDSPEYDLQPEYEASPTIGDLPGYDDSVEHETFVPGEESIDQPDDIAPVSEYDPPTNLEQADSAPLVAYPHLDPIISKPEEQPVQEVPPELQRGSWVLGPYHEWIWVEEPSRGPLPTEEELEEPELPSEHGIGFAPAAVPPVEEEHAPFVPVLPRPLEEEAALEDDEGERLKQAIADALAAYAKHAAGASLAPVTLPVPAPRPEAPYPPAYGAPPSLKEADFSLSPVSEEFQPMLEDVADQPTDIPIPAEEPLDEFPAEEPEPVGEWVEDAEGEWTWVPLEPVAAK